MNYFEGDVINKYYYPILIPIGITGNILSILVSYTLYFLQQCSSMNLDHGDLK